MISPRLAYLLKLDLDFAHHNFEPTVHQTKMGELQSDYDSLNILIFFFGKFSRFIKLHFDWNYFKHASCALVWELTNSLMHRIDLGVLNLQSGVSFRLNVLA